MPSVRGQQRRNVVAALLGAAVASGAAVGAVTGVAMIPLRWGFDLVVPSDVVIVGLVVAGVVLDGLALATGRPSPPAVGRQVPREWIDYFAPTTVALLFGARLGVGPATILSTWTWWSMTLAAGLVGLGPAVAAGAAFGLVRIAATVATSVMVEAGDASTAMPRLRANRRPGWVAIDLAALLGALVLLAPALGAAGSPAPVAPPAAGPAFESTASNSTASNSTASNSTASNSTADSPAVNGGETEGAAPVDTAPITIPARLEDIVGDPTGMLGQLDRGGRSARDPTGRQHADEGVGPAVEAIDSAAGGSPTSSSTGPSNRGGSTTDVAGRAPLADDLPAAIAGFEPVEGPTTDRFLTLIDAAELQPDPTEEVALLETRGYLGGWTRAFRNEANDVAVTAVYEFADPTEAAFYLEDGLITIGGYGGSFFEVDGLPGVRGFAQHFGQDGGAAAADGGDDGGVLALGAAFHAGPRWYLVYLVGDPETVNADVLVPVVAAQWQAVRGPERAGSS